jgi:hypothetical protein
LVPEDHFLASGKRHSASQRLLLDAINAVLEVMHASRKGKHPFRYQTYHETGCRDIGMAGMFNPSRSPVYVPAAE